MTDEKTTHTDWNRGDYDTDDIGQFTPIEPGDGLDDATRLDLIRNRLTELGRRDDDGGLTDQEASERCMLRYREVKLEAEVEEA